MGSIAREKASDFNPLNKGIHLAICNAVVDVGLQETPWGIKEKIWLGFEVPAERIQYSKDGEEIDAPQTIWKPYTKNLHKKSNLRQDLESWLGKALTKEELTGFELFKLEGKPCQIVVVHNESNDRTYANVQSITAVHSSQETPAQEIQSIRFSPNDTDQFEDLPDWLQKKFDDRAEPEQVVKTAASTTNEFADDDIPF